ncbi:glycosyltransferase family protein [Magnetospira sp. QH-2]|uniref:glycosyltransferase family protein n=1 Tax=Magnetospira sp. (strain QH-2) TaxID=1288970 RepID=UPI0003E816E4|nr:glycosyltransferase [Magnetospira sp. QH-2]CCQ74925.1 putative GT28 [Magnetospira sp. QH-2]
MNPTRDGKRILIYSHDSFGLGHLRRCRRIANYLVDLWPDLSVLIISGSPIIGSYEYRTRVDFVRVPGVIKLRNGEYEALNLHLDIHQTLDLREAIIQRTAEVFDPDLFIVDKEPLGLRGEVRSTLEMLKARGTPCVLGLRDIMDDPDILEREWERKGVVDALERFYDEIWVYGLKEIYDPLQGQAVSSRVKDRVKFTGYLSSVLTEQRPMPQDLPYRDIPYILVTPGGGGDGEEMVDWVISAYETGVDIPYPALVVFGPFMAPETQAAFQDRIDRLPMVIAMDFHSRMGAIMQRASVVVAMGGYNTFCELLSLDKPALIVPRTEPRLEQYIRATAAEKLGLVRMMDARGGRSSLQMARALCDVESWPRPSESAGSNLMTGLETIGHFAEAHLGAATGQTPLTLVQAR